MTRKYYDHDPTAHLPSFSAIFKKVLWLHTKMRLKTQYSNKDLIHLGPLQSLLLINLSYTFLFPLSHYTVNFHWYLFPENKSQAERKQMLSISSAWWRNPPTDVHGFRPILAFKNLGVTVVLCYRLSREVHTVINITSTFLILSNNCIF